MVTVAAVIGATLIALAVGQTAILLLFLWRMRRRPPLLPDDQLPNVTILLSLRGADPGLRQCLRSLMTLDYPRYDLRIAVDHEHDPAWEIVAEVVREIGTARVRVEPLVDRLETCGLKCSALAQLASGLDESCQVVALVDADVIAHRTWLRELVSPLADERVGAATGQRWYVPPEANWGSLTRCLWNAGALPTTAIFANPWAGSLAIRRCVFSRTPLIELWRRSIVDDGPLRAVVQSLGMRIAFVPGLIMSNRESCSLAFCINFIGRMMLWSRLYEPMFVVALVHALLTTVAFVGACWMLIYSLIAGPRAAIAWTAGGLVAHQAAALLLLTILERQMRQALRAHGEMVPGISPTALARSFVAVPLTQAIYSWAMLRAVTRRRVTWRGVTYEVRGPFSVRMLDDHPLPPLQPSLEANASL